MSTVVFKLPGCRNVVLSIGTACVVKSYLSYLSKPTTTSYKQSMKSDMRGGFEVRAGNYHGNSRCQQYGDK